MTTAIVPIMGQWSSRPESRKERQVKPHRHGPDGGGEGEEHSHRDFCLGDKNDTKLGFVMYDQVTAAKKNEAKRDADQGKKDNKPCCVKKCSEVFGCNDLAPRRRSYQ